MLTAHSGSDGTQENSLAFIHFFLKQNIDCLEIDIRYDKKTKLLYLHHDKQKSIKDCVLLETVLQMIMTTSSKVYINCDLKEKNLEEMVLNLARQYNLLSQIILSGNVEYQKIDNDFRKTNLFYNIELFLPEIYERKESLSEKELFKLQIFCQKHNIGTININYHFVDVQFIQMLKEVDVKISVWTVDELPLIKRFFSIGVNNITTKMAMAYLKEEAEQ